MTENSKLKLHLFLVSVFYGIYLFFLIILFYMPGGITEKEESIIFVQGWLAVPLGGAAATFLIERLRRNSYPDNNFFYPVLLLFYSVFLFLSIGIIRMSSIHRGDCSFGCLVEMFKQQMPSW